MLHISFKCARKQYSWTRLFNKNNKFEYFQPTSMLGPGICLLMAITGRLIPSPGIQSGLKQSVIFFGQSKHALLIVWYHSTANLYLQTIGVPFITHLLAHGCVDCDRRTNSSVSLTKTITYSDLWHHCRINNTYFCITVLALSRLHWRRWEM